ncbi:MAG: HD domain-containing phosphohydrolase [Candidatus Rokuibacteriota bacterium]
MSASDFRVLVVDDQAPILRFITSALNGHDCATSTASTAEEALVLVARFQFDLVISDITMPGLSGLDLLRAVKARQPDTPVVLITGSPTLDSAVFGLRHGAYDYLAKPFSAQEVRALVQRVREQVTSERRTTSRPAGLVDELARRQHGLEVFFRIGELALQGVAPDAFIDRVLSDTLNSLAGDAAVLIMMEGNGRIRTHQEGDAKLAVELIGRVQSSIASLQATSSGQTLVLSSPGEAHRFLAAITALGADTKAVLCLGRSTSNGAFLPDERELLLGFAKNTALALERMRLGQDAEKNLVNTITAFVNAIESKDRHLKGHSSRVSLFAGALAREMGLSAEEELIVCRGAILHDLGKLAIIDTILSKPGLLTAEEFAIMKDHVEVGYRILKPLCFLEREALAVRHHHERYDGTGYPDGLAGEAIPLIARIVSTADAFDAMTSDRPYRQALSFDVALAEIKRGSGTQFDPATAEAFLRIPRGRLLEICEGSTARTASGLAASPAELHVGAVTEATS